MVDQDTESVGPMAHRRRVTVEALVEHFANDAMGVDEFERRVDVAHRASTPDELKELLVDLPGGDLPAVRTESRVAPAGAGVGTGGALSTRENEYVVSILGGSQRKGRWSPARRTHAIAVLGGTQLDFREAVLPPGVTQVRVFALCGGVEIIVPPGLQVESRGVALLGGFDHMAEVPLVADPETPMLEITGLALMSGVEVSVRHPGESARDARRRRRMERREQRRRLRGG
jgi:hypothetical protein